MLTPLTVIPFFVLLSIVNRIQTLASTNYQNVGGMNTLVGERLAGGLGSMLRYHSSIETWLDARIVSSYVFGDDYDVFRCDRNMQYSRKTTGGVLIAISCNMKARVTEDNSWSTVEQVWVAIRPEGRQLYLG